jgi:hypothetical protein
MTDTTGWAPPRRTANTPTRSNDPDDGPFDPWTITHADHPVVGDDGAAVLDAAIVALTLRRTPMALGDGLADLHAIVSLHAQLQAWLPVAVANAGRRATPGPTLQPSSR